MADDFISSGLTGGLFDVGSSSTGSSSFSGIGSLFGGIGSIVGGIGSIAAGGQTKSAFDLAAQGYDTAALYAQQNALLAGQSANIQETGAARTIQRTQGAQASAAAANGLNISGNALDLIHDTARQGALTEGMIGLQGAINIQNFEAQSAALHAQAQSARATGAAAQTASRSSGIGGILGGLGSIAGAAFSLFSDRRLKRDIEQVGELPNGLPVYSYRFIWSDAFHYGLMADEVEQLIPEAVTTTAAGYKMVNYALVRFN